MVSRSFDVCTIYVVGVGAKLWVNQGKGVLERILRAAQINGMDSNDKVGVCNYKMVGFRGPSKGRRTWVWVNG